MSLCTYCDRLTPGLVDRLVKLGTSSRCEGNGHDTCKVDKTSQHLMRREGRIREREERGWRAVTWKPTNIVVYHSTGSMTDVPHSVAVEMEKKSIFKNSSIGEGDLPSETLFHPLGYRSEMELSVTDHTHLIEKDTVLTETGSCLSS